MVFMVLYSCKNDKLCGQENGQSIKDQKSPTELDRANLSEKAEIEFELLMVN